MRTLWLQFAQDSSLPARMDEGARARFAALFDTNAADSAWNRALTLLGLEPSWKPSLLLWHGDRPYINWSYVVRLISGDIVAVEPADGGSFRYRTRYRISRIPMLIRRQWHISWYVASRLQPGFILPKDDYAQISESIALGLALLSVTMRLPTHTPEQLAGWLAEPHKQRGSLRRALAQMQEMQQLRSRLTPAWQALFPDDETHIPDAVPLYFWDEPPEKKPVAENDDNATSWQGIAVSGRSVTCRSVLVSRVKEADVTGPEPRALIFPLARPESVELYGQAQALLFAEGGVMSHACTVAREMNLPCITGLGQGFLVRIREELIAQKEIWLQIDIPTGTVSLLKR